MKDQNFHITDIAARRTATMRIEQRVQRRDEDRRPRLHHSRRTFRRLFFLCLMLGIFLSVFSVKVLFSSEVVSTVAHLPIIKHVATWTHGIEKTYGKHPYTNALIMGMAGRGYDGGLLTDTMIFASYDARVDHAVMISIPRDLLVPVSGRGMQKINSANAYGEQDRYPGGGSKLAADTVAKMFDEPIDYYVRVDFEGFVRAVDLLGGVDVTVDRAFSDSQYPTDDFLTQTVSFEQGEQRMDGATALIFARSRHGNNGEGSDFARARRQQKIITAVKKKVFALDLLLNPKRLAELGGEIAAHVETNVKPWQASDLLTLARKLNSTNVTHIVLDDGPQGLLLPRITDSGAFVLVPRSGDYEDIQKRLADAREQGRFLAEAPRVYILNGTTEAGKAKSIAQGLEESRIVVKGVGNSPRQDYEKTVIYTVSDEKKKQTLAYLKDKLHANTADTLPQYLVDSPESGVREATDPKNVDFLIVLGME